MEIVRIFDREDYLLAVRYKDETYDEFSRLFEEWADIAYLEEFFTANEADLKRSFWKGISIEEAILKTINEASELNQHFLELSKLENEDRIEFLRKWFRPLSKLPDRIFYLEKKKMYGLKRKGWLRIYALKVGEDMYLITGGAIKLTDNMEERNHTRKELQKIEFVRQFLKNQGIID
jgi:hypothetical protein